MQTRDNSQKGQAIIEFALVLPILILIIGSIIELGVLFYDKQVITNASREGARAGIVYLIDKDNNKLPPDPDIQETVLNYCKDKLITFGAPELPVVNPVDPGNLAYPSDLTVTVRYEYTFILAKVMNLFGANLGPTINISAQTVMRME